MQPTVKEIVYNYRRELSSNYSSHEAFHFVWLVFEYLYGWSKTDLMLRDDTKLTDSEHLFVQNALERLKNHEPIQYILGEAEFFGLPFDVNPSVLIPRPETEELVEWILQSLDPARKLRILDVGTGSGCIAVSLAKNLPHAEVFAWDVSSSALQVARQNAQKNETNIYFEKQDILALDENEMPIFDVVVSNPPYVRTLEKSQMKENVLNHEPHLALFVEDHDPLLFYRKIALLSARGLSPQGLLFFEINREFGEETKNLLVESKFRNIKLRADLSGNHRMIQALAPA